MSNSVSDERRLSPAAAKRREKNMRRAQAKRAAARAAAARRRRRVLAYVGSGLATLALVVGVAAACGAFESDPGTPDASVSPSVTASASAPTTVELPADADPALKTKPVVKAGTGDLKTLKVTTLIEGKGAPAASGQSVTVNYVGVRFKTGEQFDASWDSGRPFPFTLGAGGVIKGWDQGLLGVKVGSRVQLDIPSDLAYGDTPPAGYPAGPLRFVVDLLSAG